MGFFQFQIFGRFAVQQVDATPHSLSMGIDKRNNHDQLKAGF